MRILISSSSFLLTDSLGTGEGIACYEIIRRLIERGHDVVVISNESRVKDKRINSRIINLGIPLYPMVSELREEIGWHYFSFKALEVARDVLKKRGIDVVHHMLPSYMGRYSLMPILGKPFVYGPISTEHTDIDFNTEFVGDYVHLSRFEKQLVRKLEAVSRDEYKKTLEVADKIVVTLDAVKEELPQEFGKKMLTIPLGVDAKSFFPAPEKEKRNLVLSVGAMTKIKGFDYLIRAIKLVAREIPGVKLVLVGDGPDLGYFQSIVRGNGLENTIEFVGEIPHWNVSTMFQKCSLYCQPSLSESFGIARLEAMASGKPVVYSVSGAGEKGFESNPGLGGSVKPRDVAALSDEILRFLRDDMLRVEAGAKNREFVEKYHDWEVITDEYEKLYNSLVG